MARTVLDTPMGQMVYSDALLRMAGGAQLLPHEQDILTLAPLPESFISPFASQESGLLETLRTTAKALDIWDEEIRKVNYFTKHFTDLSKMVLKGVTTMGRGLMSLHTMGEDLSLSPKSIQDLIMIASYHFRKSYIGVMQTVKKYPEVSTRLLVNQLDWANMIFRLNATKAKLAKPMAKPSVVSYQLPVDSEKDAVSSQLPAASVVDSCQLPVESEAASELSELKPISEPKSIGASRAFSPLAACGGKVTSSRQSAACVNSARMMDEEKKDADRKEIEDQNQKSNKGNEIRVEENAINEKEDKPNSPENTKSENIDETNSKKGTRTKKESETNFAEKEIREEENKTDPDEYTIKENNSSAFSPDNTTVNKENKKVTANGQVINDTAPETDGGRPSEAPPPSYADIVIKAVERNKGNPGGIRFTLKEVRQLVANPDFCHDNPDTASQFRAILMRAGP